MIYRTMSEDEYGKLRGIRASWVKTLWSSTPAHLQHRMVESEESDALRFGAALHDRILRPEAFGTEWVVMPRVDRRTKDGKARAEAFEAETQALGLRWITEDESRTLAGMMHMVEQTRLGALLELCPERELAMDGEIAGQPCKARIDACCLESNLLVDIKTTVSAAPRAFRSSCVQFGYLPQMAFYREMLRQNGSASLDGEVVLAAMEKSAPYGVALYRLSSDDLDRALVQVEQLVRRIAECMATNDWPCYQPLPVDLAMPEYAFTTGGAE